MLAQKSLRLLQNGLPLTGKIPPQTLLVNLLKRQARTIMRDITECPPGAIPAHLSRASDWRELVMHLFRHDLKETAESAVSGAQLLYPSTLADYVALVAITLKDHRAPAFLNLKDTEFETLHHKLDLIAGAIAAFLGGPVHEDFTNTQGEEERV